jgi:hypothetical protein
LHEDTSAGDLQPGSLTTLPRSGIDRKPSLEAPDGD